MKGGSGSTAGDELTIEAGIDGLRGRLEGARLAIVGTGVSMTRFPLSLIDGFDAAIGLDWSLRIYLCDFVVFTEPEAVTGLGARLSLGGGDRVVTVNDRVAQEIRVAKPDLLTGRSVRDELRAIAGVHEVEFGGGGSLGAALELARWLGGREAHLFGVDACREFGRRHGFEIANPDRPSGETLRSLDREGARWSAPEDTDLVRWAAATAGSWGPMSVFRATAGSELACFPERLILKREI